MTNWENLPMPEASPSSTPLPTHAVWASWASFSLDPRVSANAGLRTSQADRDYAVALVDQALATGRVSPQEHSERRQRAGEALTFGAIAPVVSDLMVQPMGTGLAVPVGRQRGLSLGTWIGLSFWFNLLWLLISVSVMHPVYYFPAWPMVGMAIPLILRYFNTGSFDLPPAGPEEAVARRARKASRLARQAERHRRRALLHPERAGREVARAGAHEARAAALLGRQQDELR
jgi:hypothetical protein